MRLDNRSTMVQRVEEDLKSRVYSLFYASASGHHTFQNNEVETTPKLRINFIGGKAILKKIMANQV